MKYPYSGSRLPPPPHPRASSYAAPHSRSEFVVLYCTSNINCNIYIYIYRSIIIKFSSELHAQCHIDPKFEKGNAWQTHKDNITELNTIFYRFYFSFFSWKFIYAPFPPPPRQLNIKTIKASHVLGYVMFSVSMYLCTCTCTCT